MSSNINVDLNRYSPPTEPKELLTKWIERCRKNQFAHYEKSIKLKRTNLLIGIAVLLFSSSSAALLTASFSGFQDYFWDARILGIILSTSASTLALLQIFTGLSENAERHRSAAASYGAIRRELEQIYSSEKTDQYPIDQVRHKLDSLSHDSPKIPKENFIS